MDRKKAEELVEQYVDGVLPPAEVKDFERCIAGDPALQGAVEEARCVCAGLTNLCIIERQMGDFTVWRFDFSFGCDDLRVGLGSYHCRTFEDFLCLENGGGNGSI